MEGKISEAITYYQDEHTLAGICDFVMANPPFNVDLVDAERINGDPRLPFGFPGVNKQKKVGNGNYLWISYFWSYLSATGCGGFVMSSQASSAGRRDGRCGRDDLHSLQLLSTPAPSPAALLSFPNAGLLALRHGHEVSSGLPQSAGTSVGPLTGRFSELPCGPFSKPSRRDCWDGSDPLQRASRGMLQMHSTRAALIKKGGIIYLTSRIPTCPWSG